MRPPKLNHTLTKEQEKQIRNYGGDNIKTIKLFVDSVRKNPGQYLSSIGNEGMINCIREIFQNATDELNRKVSPCDEVWIEFFEGSFRTIVMDNGRGIDPGDMVRVFTREHTSTNFDKKEGEYPSGLHGVGSKCVNAVSSRFTVTAYRLGVGYKIEFSEGKPLAKYGVKDKKTGDIVYVPERLPDRTGAQGTIVDFEPDFDILKEITITNEDVYRLVSNLVPLFKPGAKINYLCHKLDGTEFKDTLINEDGVLTYIIRKTDKPLIKPIIFGFDNGKMKVDAALTYVANINAGADVTTYANMSPVNTQLSTPSKGFFRGVTDFFKTYMNKIFLANSKRKIEATNSDILTGLVGAVASAHMNVMFDGQAKNVCKNGDLEPFVKDVTLKALQDWSKKNPEDLQKICNFFKDVATARTKAEKEKTNVIKKYKGDTITGIPEGFIKAENRDHLELFIVEGLSAASPCQTSRDTKYQAIFPIRGKMSNAFSKSREAFLKNEEVQAILSILNCGYGKNFDISKCKYDKIIILSDADYDGFHIRSLVLKFLLVYCRPLIEEGRVYAVLSPLYHVNKGTKKWRYFIDKDDFTKYVRDEFCKENKIAHLPSKKEFTKHEISSLIINNNNYDFYMDRISSNYMIDPILLEDLLLLRNEAYKNFNKFKETISKKYKYLKCEKKNNSILINGLVNGIHGDREHTIIFNDQLLNACTPLLPYLDKSEKRYLLNGKKIGLYQIISTFRNSEPKNIERAKGLGSLNDLEIGESTLSPENRKLLRYTTQDISNEIEEIRRVNDDKFKLIENVDISQYEF